MKKLDKMKARKGRKDIDYILATPYFDEESVGRRGKAAVQRTGKSSALDQDESPKAVSRDATSSMNVADIGISSGNGVDTQIMKT